MCRLYTYIHVLKTTFRGITNISPTQTELAISKEMAHNNNTNSSICIVTKSDTFQMILMFAVLPFHILLVKALGKSFQLELPRHIIMFSLSLSDAILVCGLFISALIYKLATLTIQTTGCMLLRAFTIFIPCTKLVVTSLSVVAMAAERYIACVHSFQLHLIMTETRVRFGSIFVWLLGLAIGLIAVCTNNYNAAVIIRSNSPVHFIYVGFVIPSSVLVTCIQARLFFFSRSKLNPTNTTGAFGAQLELADYRKKQLKVAFVAGIVALAFVFCMTPLAFHFLVELLTGKTASSSYRATCLALSIGNSLADPLIYGFGTADTRRMILRDLKRLKQFIARLFSDFCQRQGNKVVNPEIELVAYTIPTCK